MKRHDRGLLPMGNALFTTLLCLTILLNVASTIAADKPDPELLKRLREVASSADSFPDHFEAEVWLTDMSARLARQVTDSGERLEILKRVHHEATERGLAPELVLAVIDVESNFDRYAISHAGAFGLMQIMPFWLEEIGEPQANLIRIDTNVRFGCTILKYYMDIENNDLMKALGRYNGSLGRQTYPNKVLDKLRNKWYRV
jgi:soluble lytic murein transglycosylase-like protein